VWEIRVFTGRDTSGKPTQISKTVRGTKREAQRVAAALESRPPSNAGGRTVAEVLAHYSPLGYTAGDVVSLGTVSGVAAFSADPQAWYLKPGDVMEARIERLGTLTNPVVSWAQAHGSAAPAVDGHVAG